MSEVIADELHADAIDAAMALDREYAELHPDVRWITRPAVPHEMCIPNGPCVEVQLVQVAFIGPGVRARRPIAA
jgi:hypothetical protein